MTLKGIIFMNLNKTTKYALQIFSLMALNENKMHTAIELSEQLKIPYRYLRKLLTEFNNKGFLKSTKGKTGGFSLSKKNHEISLYDIVYLTDETHFSTSCFFGFKECPLINVCSMHDKWTSVREMWLEILKETTLEDIKNQNINEIFLKNKLLSI
ncbi:conserved hypothetical protein [uncultured Paludibacter sp.]|uniref:Transcriptional regulator, BadM/Rrf2 family n=1 Tax=uncultured Paludibacter sp. TaxID=497635 RepID=A0A653AED2_9BACT|nr:conserved hypothetical protein [uncultured Paludibacter sp.]